MMRKREAPITKIEPQLQTYLKISSPNILNYSINYNFRIQPDRGQVDNEIIEKKKTIDNRK